MEKAKKVTKTLADLPAWYRRIRSSKWDDEDGYPELPRDIFDEDLSELEEEEEEEDDFECHCKAAEEPEFECECYPEPCSVSERSYDGSDARQYYNLKELRECHKMIRKDEDELWETQTQKMLENHRHNVESVRAVYEGLKEERRKRKKKKREKKEKKEKVKKVKREKREKRKTHPIIFHPIYTAPAKRSKYDSDYSLTYKKFQLYSIDYWENFYRRHEEEHCWTSLTLYEKISRSDGEPSFSQAKASSAKTESRITGYIYVNCDYQFEFSLSHVPEYPSLKRYWSDKWEGGYKVGVQFIGENCIRMLVSRDIIMKSEPKPLPASAPEIFEFVGIDEKNIKSKAETEKW